MSAVAAIKSLSIGGRVERAEILVGSNDFGLANADAQLGKVTVGGDWIASRIAVGTSLGADGLAGTDDDTFIGAGSATIVSTIASITIKGQALGTVSAFPGADSFRFMAEKIGALKVGGVAFPLDKTGPDNLPVGATGDLRVFDNA
jgi:hypothetical protein